MPIPLTSRLRMWLQGVPARKIERALRLAEQQRLPVTLRDLEIHHLSGGDPERVVQAAATLPLEDRERRMAQLFSAAARGLNLPDFIERGLVSEAEVEERNLKEAALRDEAAARRYLTMLAGQRAALDEVHAHLSSANMSEADRERERDKLTNSRASIENQVAALRARWPGLES